jgi:hypothetical protein
MSEHHSGVDEEDSYLWDGTGRPDPAVASLEKRLRVLRHGGSVPPLPQRSRAGVSAFRTRRIWIAAAAALVLAAGAAWLILLLRSSAWTVNSIAGTPAIAGRAIVTAGQLKRGEWLVTDNSSRARIAVGSIGRVDVDPNTRVQLVETGREHRMALERGTIHARIWAPPKLFFVNTQAAVAVDLGCAYTLQVDDRGEGMLRVTSGWVGLERDGRAAYVPEGAVCPTRRDAGPGTPRYDDAPSGYGEALGLLDFGSPADPRRTAAYELVLGTARRKDAMTLWHLLVRGTPDERARVYDRLASLVPPPRGVTREQILAGDRLALDRWWDQLGVGVNSWWRLLKKKW